MKKLGGIQAGRKPQRKPGRGIGVLGAVVLWSPGCGDRDASTGPEILIEATRIAESRRPSPAEVAPYDEALVVDEYRVEEVMEGDLAEERIRVARWAILNGVVQASSAGGEGTTHGEMTVVPLDSVPGLDAVPLRDDLPLDADMDYFLDLSQSLAAPTTPDVLRADYRGELSQRMRYYWEIRHQLKLVVLGNSHADCAVALPRLYQVEQEVAPVCISLAAAGSGLPLQALIAREYVARLPRLEWVIWGVSPRIFNDRNRHDRRHELFIDSPGYEHDVEHAAELWPVDATAPIMTAEDLRERFGFRPRHLGWAARATTDFAEPLNEVDAEKIRALGRLARFEESETLWALFEDCLGDLTVGGARVLLFTPPYHPLFAETNAIDANGTGRGDYHGIVERLEALAEDNPRVAFLDLNRAGHHDFRHEEFANADHLRRTGALRLTETLARRMSEIAAEAID